MPVCVTKATRSRRDVSGRPRGSFGGFIRRLENIGLAGVNDIHAMHVGERAAIAHPHDRAFARATALTKRQQPTTHFDSHSFFLLSCRRISHSKKADAMRAAMDEPMTPA